MFFILMALGAGLAWIWLPDVQYGATGQARDCSLPSLHSKELEVLAKGRAYAIAPHLTAKDRS
jgi:hypothetical protein